MTSGVLLIVGLPYALNSKFAAISYDLNSNLLPVSESFVPTRIRGTKPIFSCRAIPGTAGFSPWSPYSGFRVLDEMMLPSPSPHGILSPACSEPLSLNGYSLNQGAREAPQASPRTEFISGGLFTLWFAYDWHFLGRFHVDSFHSLSFPLSVNPLSEVETSLAFPWIEVITGRLPPSFSGSDPLSVNALNEGETSQASAQTELVAGGCLRCG